MEDGQTHVSFVYSCCTCSFDNIRGSITFGGSAWCATEVGDDCFSVQAKTMVAVIVIVFVSDVLTVAMRDVEL